MNSYNWKRMIAICFVIVMFAITASAQIDIRKIKSEMGKDPQPKNPPTTNTNRNKTPHAAPSSKARRMFVSLAPQPV